MMHTKSHPIAVIGIGPIGIAATARLPARDQTHRIPALAEAGGEEASERLYERETLASTPVPVHMGATTGKGV